MNLSIIVLDIRQLVELPMNFTVVILELLQRFQLFAESSVVILETFKYLSEPSIIILKFFKFLSKSCIIIPQLFKLHSKISIIVLDLFKLLLKSSIVVLEFFKLLSKASVIVLQLFKLLSETSIVVLDLFKLLFESSIVVLEFFKFFAKSSVVILQLFQLLSKFCIVVLQFREFFNHVPKAAIIILQLNQAVKLLLNLGIIKLFRRCGCLGVLKVLMNQLKKSLNCFHDLWLSLLEVALYIFNYCNSLLKLVSSLLVLGLILYMVLVISGNELLDFAENGLGRLFHLIHRLGYRSTKGVNEKLELFSDCLGIHDCSFGNDVSSFGGFVSFIQHGLKFITVSGFLELLVRLQLSSSKDGFGVLKFSLHSIEHLFQVSGDILRLVDLLAHSLKKFAQSLDARSFIVELCLENLLEFLEEHLDFGNFLAYTIDLLLPLFQSFLRGISVGIKFLLGFTKNDLKIRQIFFLRNIGQVILLCEISKILFLREVYKIFCLRDVGKIFFPRKVCKIFLLSQFRKIFLFSDVREIILPGKLSKILLFNEVDEIFFLCLDSLDIGLCHLLRIFLLIFLVLDDLLSKFLKAKPDLSNQSFHVGEIFFASDGVHVGAHKSHAFTSFQGQGLDGIQVLLPDSLFTINQVIQTSLGIAQDGFDSFNILLGSNITTWWFHCFNLDPELGNKNLKVLNVVLLDHVYRDDGLLVDISRSSHGCDRSVVTALSNTIDVGPNRVQSRLECFQNFIVGSQIRRLVAHPVNTGADVVQSFVEGIDDFGRFISWA
ncbi:unnamed protein product [Clonostachys solani]|uniref:Uncharacterized protein n=1 Tax=Clonostachys solani TaxID=160281 RepID=A0A9N9ZMJ1_9HYPO|nr:unnamed protein product [Clonostachys solani]